MDRYQFGGLVFAVNYDFARLERNFCKVAGLYPGQPRILTILQENEGVTLSGLSPLCGIGLPSLSVSVRNLQKSGLVRKEGKKRYIFLTEVGRQRAFAFHTEIDAFYMGLLQRLGPDGFGQLSRAFSDFDSYIRQFNRDYEAAHGWSSK